MLVLSRKRMQSIQVDNDIVITVVAIHGNQVRIGIDAPPEVSVRRTELLLRRIPAPPITRPSLWRNVAGPGHSDAVAEPPCPDRLWLPS